MADKTNYYSDENLERIKKNISDSYVYFEDNYKRFRDFKKFVFCESVDEGQRSMLRDLGRPSIEFNILEAYISRLLGEFSKHEPSIVVSPSQDSEVSSDVCKLVEDHIRHLMYEANKNSFSYEIYKDLLAGGFSVAKVTTEYASPMSFDQIIKWEKEFDSCLCGFDSLARTSHKGDGQFSFSIRPLLEDDFRTKFPDFDMSSIEYDRDIEEFNWNFVDGQQRKLILVAEYYEKKKKNIRIVKLANGNVMPLKQYKKLKYAWEANQIIEQIPVIVGHPRDTVIENICHYKLMQNKILEYRETDYGNLPHVFFDGNSVFVSRDTKSNQVYQMTRPYVFHAKGIQQLKNFSGQTLANHLQTLVQHKWIVKKEAIPEEKDYLEALTNPQRANTLVVNAFQDDNPEMPIPDPITPVQQMPAPPEVMATFSVTDPTTQVILGSYASNLGQNDNDLSGKAVIESQSVGNAAAMPFNVGYLAGLNQMAIITKDLMPKYVLGKRRLPVTDKAGEKGYVEVNSPGSPQLDYNSDSLNVCIEAGLNFQVQKTQALQQITSLMQASEQFASFMNSEQGLPILVDNLVCYGADRLKEGAKEWMEEQKQQQAQAVQQQQQMMQNDPGYIKAQADAQKVQLEAMQMQMDKMQQEFDNQIEIAKLANEKILNDAKMLEAQAKVNDMQINAAVRLEEAQTGLERHALDAAAKMAEVKSRQHNDHLETIKLDHEIKQSKKGDSDGND